MIPILRTLSVALCSVSVIAPVAGCADDQVETWVERNVDGLFDLYCELHQAPELSFQEEQTAKRMAEELRKLDIEVTEKVGGHGVVGLLKNGSGKVLMLRADMDALPIAEETGLEYASKIRTTDERGATVGVMHACGHDIHMANLIGVAKYLAEHRDAWQGTVVFILQPAEERGAGAAAMLADGLFARFPRPDFAVAIHVSSETPVGTLGYRPGYSQANVDSVDIVIKGRGGHGAYPETTIDPIVIVARLILDLQTIVSREIPAIEPAVITVGSIQGGAKHNVISDECRLQLTVRSYTPEIRQQLHDAIRRKTNAASQSAGAPEPELRISEGTSALYNDPELTARIATMLKQTFGEEKVEEVPPSMGGEDFSRYGEAGVPICMFKVGAISQKRLDEFIARGETPPSLHSPQFYPDGKETLSVGVAAMTSVALDLLPRGEIEE